MKKVLTYIAIALAAIGCDKEERISSYPTDDEIRFSAGVIATRVSSDDDCAWVEGDEIGIFSDQSDESNLKYTISDAATGQLSGEGFYPLSSGKRTYYAYYPYSDAQDETNLMEVDCSAPLLWATATSNDVEVTLRFSHKLAKVSFKLTAGGVDATVLDDATAWLEGAYSKGEFDITSGEFTSLSDDDTITLTISEDDVITLYLPPMSGVSESVKLWINADNNTFLYLLDTDEWESGNSYSYNITVGEEISDITNDGDDYFVYTAAGLFEFAKLVNEGNLGFNCTLMRDIDLGGAEWTPIGTDYDNKYSGTFDGGGHLISGLSVTGSDDYVGLFRCTSGSAQISNLGVDGSVSGVGCVGGVVGMNYGTITNCYNTGSVSGVSGVGGVVGLNSGTITNCYNTGIVSVNEMVVGGVVGINEGTITNCYNTGSVSGEWSVGGVVGINEGTITNCYNTGSVSGYDFVGGVVGENYDTITNCYYLDSVTSDKNATEMSQEEMQDTEFVTTLNAGGSAWVADTSPNINDGYPILSWQVAAESD